MKFFAPSFLLQSYTLSDALSEIAKLGFCGCEIWYEHLSFSPTSTKVIKSFPLEFSLHAPSWDLNPTSRIKPIREFAANQVLSSLEFAAEIEAKTVVVHPGEKSNPKNEFEVYEGYLLDFMAKVTARAKTLGLVVAVEIMDATANQLVNSPQTANFLTSLFPSLVVCFDIAHAGRFADPLEFLAKTNRVEHFHLSNATKEIPHTALVDGALDIKQILTYIDQHYHDVVVATEGYDAAAELDLVKKNCAFLKSLGFIS